MSIYYYGPALDAELDYRRGVLRHDADTHRLARQARRAVRSGIRAHAPARRVSDRPAIDVRPAPAAAGTPEPSPQPAGSVRSHSRVA